MKTEDLLRQELLALIGGGNAHMTLEEVVDAFPPDRMNAKAPHMPYSPWHILEHMRRVQEDIVVFVEDPDHVSPEWPAGYFPDPGETTNKAGWRRALKAFLADRTRLEAMAADPATDLFAPIPHAPNYTVYREILLAADHNAYHAGELAFMRQVLAAWPEGGELYDEK